MPNFANGVVRVKGKPEDITNFCKHFVFEDEGDKKGKYFARSFIHETWEDFLKENKKEISENYVEFGVDFAWSAHSCIVEGYPNGEECITLEWACKEHNVEVDIDTEETGIGFTEEIHCDKDSLSDECYDIPEYKCSLCGETQQITDSEDREDVECWECEEIPEWGVVEK